MSPLLERDSLGRAVYVPDGPVLKRFLQDRSPVSLIRGPIGSGTSSVCCIRIWSHAIEQAPGPDGIRRSRWAVIRNTFPSLRDTTLKTWKFWFPEDLYGDVKMGRPFVHHIKVGDVDLEVLFMALDNPDDVNKLKSLELTGAWLNEIEYIHKDIFDETDSRTGRYPPMVQGGPTWYGTIADMNAPQEDHWVPMLMGEVDLPEEMSLEERSRWQRPATWGYFVQPSALIETRTEEGSVRYVANPMAENTKFLPSDYYDRRVAGRSKEWIDSRLMNKIILFSEGDPVHTSFNDSTHMATGPLKVVPGYPVRVGLDFGRSPAALFGQLIENRWFIQAELIGKNEGATQFAPKVKRVLEQLYAGHEVIIHGDPKGRDKPQTDNASAYDVFASYGLRVQAAPVKQNAIRVRLDAVDYVLDGMVGGMPRMLISTTCRMFRKALKVGYVWSKAGDGTKEPEKNDSSHIADAGQYLVLGGGEGRSMAALPALGSMKPVQMYAPHRSRRRVRA